MNDQTIYFILLVLLMIDLNKSKVSESYSLKSVNLRKFGLSFGERRFNVNKSHSHILERLRQDIEKEGEKEKIQREMEAMKRMQIIHKYLMPLAGSTSFLKDIHGRL